MASCLLCGSTRLTALYDDVQDRLGISTKPHRFLRCQDCGSATLDPLPTPESIATLYPVDYTFRPADEGESAWRRRLRELEWRAFYERAYRRRLAILQRLTGVRRGRVLEIGCGSGLFLRCLRDAGYRAEGLEMSERDAARARRLGLHVSHGTLHSAQLTPGAYDLVLLIYVLEHVLDPRDVVAQLARLVAPGGWLVLGLPVIDSLQARLLGARWVAVTEAPRHITLPSFDGARSLLRKAGFTDVRTAPCPLLENAGHIALSLIPTATTARSALGSVGAVARRIAGGLTIIPALPVAWFEQRGARALARAGTTFFCGRR